LRREPGPTLFYSFFITEETTLTIGIVSDSVPEVTGDSFFNSIQQHGEEEEIIHSIQLHLRRITYLRSWSTKTYPSMNQTKNMIIRHVSISIQTNLRKT